MTRSHNDAFRIDLLMKCSLLAILIQFQICLLAIIAEGYNIKDIENSGILCRSPDCVEAQIWRARFENLCADLNDAVYLGS